MPDDDEKPPNPLDVASWPIVSCLSVSLHRAPDGKHAVMMKAEDAVTVQMLSQAIIILQQSVHALLMLGVQTVGEAKERGGPIMDCPETPYKEKPTPVLTPKGGWKH